VRLTITNRSAWPDWFMRPLCEWVAERAGITWDYKWLQRSTSLPRNYGGRGGRRSGRAWYSRRRCPPITADHRFQWSGKFSMMPGLPSLVFLIAHEMYHATGGHPDKFSARTNAGLGGTRINRASMEERCNRFGRATAAAFVEEWWPMMKPRLLESLRRARARRHAKAERERAASAHRSSPDVRIADAERKLAEWERRVRLAENRAAKYRRRLAALRRAHHVH